MLKNKKHTVNTNSINHHKQIPDETSLELEEMVTQEIIRYSKHVLETGDFFNPLKKGNIDVENLKYVFAQYRYWRDQFHTWFGLCILKSGSCVSDETQKEVKELADHIVVEMKENHTGMYLKFLSNIGVDTEDLQHWKKGNATRQYEQSFINVFGTDTTNFIDSVIALSARELFASIRNAFVAKAFKQHYGINQSPWWELHEHLEVEHFRGAIRPIIKRLSDPVNYDRSMNIMKDEIDRHVSYWAALLKEAIEVDSLLVA